MRIFYLLSLTAAFGCAHQSNAPQAAANATEPASASQPAPAAQTALASERQPGQAAAGATLPCSAVRVHFAFDSDAIADDEKPRLDAAAACLSSNRRLRVRIEGNTDEIGSQAYNRHLGQRRAATVATYLENKGVSSAQLEKVISYGEDNPVCNENDAECFARNRRAAVRATCHL
jgi:peptidoglycan-associated lipoprotein